MRYDFDQYIDRTHTNSVKWERLKQLFGVTDVLPMWIADMEFMSPQPIIEVLKRRVEHGIFGYTLTSDSYLQAIIDWQQRRHAFAVQKEWLCHSPGVVMALSAIILTYTEVGDGIIIQSPVYHPFRELPEKLGRTVISNPLKCEEGYHYMMDYEDLEAKAARGAKLLILCSPHNPIGRVWLREELEALGQICQKYHILVVTDEIYGDLVYQPHKHTPFASISEEFAQNSITCIAASKTFNLSGLHASTIIIPDPHLRERYMELTQTMFISHLNIFGLLATETAYRHGEEWLDQLLSYLQANQQFMIEYFREYFPRIKVVPAEGSYLVWLDFRELGINTTKLNEFLLHQARVAFIDGSSFGPEGEGFQRANIACPRAQLAETCQRLKDAVHSIFRLPSRQVISNMSVYKPYMVWLHVEV